MTKTLTTSLLASLLLTGCATVTAQSSPPPLEWVQGPVVQVLSQPVEDYHVATIQGEEGNVLVQICHPYTGQPKTVETDNTLYDLLRSALYHKRDVEVAYRDFGEDPQSGSRKRCIDRISVRS